MMAFGGPMFNAEEADKAAKVEVPIKPADASAVTTRSMPLKRRSSPKLEGVDSARLGMLPRLPDNADELKSIAVALQADPAKVLKEFGLDPEGAQVTIEAPGTPGPTATADSAVKLWNDGKKAGKIRFIYPEEPPQDLKTAVLSDLDLEAVAGGWSVGSCCCTPCCSC